MNLKPLSIFVFCLVTVVPAIQAQTTQKTKFTDPVEYNEFIVGQQTVIGTELLALIAMFEDLPYEKAVTMKQLDKVVATAKAAIQKMEDLQPMSNEFGMRAAAIDLFKFYKAAMEVDYRTVINELYSDVPNLDKLDQILVKIQEEEAGYDDAFQRAQEKFASFHNIQLQENELQERFDE